jgi:ankyrin repeat protein
VFFSARLLLRSGADVNLERSGGQRPLAAAVRVEADHPRDFKQRKLATARLLLEAGADPNVAGSLNWGTTTPLIVATRGGFIEGMQLLLDHGADPNIEIDGETAMSVAEQIKPKKLAKEVVKFLKPFLEG